MVFLGKNSGGKTYPSFFIFYYCFLVGEGGIEPPTSILSEWRSTTELLTLGLALTLLFPFLFLLGFF